MRNTGVFITLLEFLLPSKHTTSLLGLHCLPPIQHPHYENMPIQIYWKFHWNWKFSDKNSDVFHISAQIIYYGYSLEPPRRGGSNEYLQSMFLSKNKKNNVYPCKPQFCYIKVGFNGVKIIKTCFHRQTVKLPCSKFRTSTSGAPIL